VKLETLLVGRESELAQLHKWLDKGLNGERQIVFLTGEPGIGKTTVVEAFLNSLESSVRRLALEDHKPPLSEVQTLDSRREILDACLWVGRGQCIEHYGAGEPYMPIFAALGRLCREPDAQRLIDILSSHAPTWLVQMPSLLKAAELERLQRTVQGATRERMLREMAEALEAASSECPLILVLEDLHWSDYSTLELLAILARRRDRARLMVLATYRPAHVAINGHALRRVLDELQLHGHSNTLSLSFLTRSNVATYLLQRFPHNSFSRELAEVIHQRTDGSPLFMVSMIDDLVQQTRITQVNGQWRLLPAIEKEVVGIPGDLTHIIMRQIEDLSEVEQRILETASVAGAEFSSALVAAVVAEEVEVVETYCDTLVRQERFLQSSTPCEWPDGTLAARYRFVHALHRDVFYNRLAVSARARLHRWVGERQEAAYRERVQEIASELAMHFEQGREYQRAVHYHQQAGENALRRSAHQEALAHFDAGLRLLKKLPASSERSERELTLQIARAAPLGMVHGYGSPAVEEAYERARTLCQQVSETPRLFPVLAGLASVCHMRGKLRQAHKLEGQLFRIAQNATNQTFLLWAHLLQGVTAYNRGQLSLARTQLEAGMRFYDPSRHNPQASGGREDPGILCLTSLVSSLWLLGYPDQALHRLHEALALAEQSADPLSRVMVLGQAAVLHQRRREGPAALRSAEAFLTLAQGQGFSFRAATGLIYRGWALADCGEVNEGITQIRAGLEALEETGAILARPYYLALLSEAYGKAEQIEVALQVLKQALTLAHMNDERFYEAELYRLKGELALQQGARGWRLEPSPPSSQASSLKPLVSQAAEQEAEGYFLKAIEVARRQQAKSLELRAALSLSRLWQQQDRKEEAHKLLVKIYGWFTEGFDTRDLQEAKILLH
jgi:predicted ATPase